MAMLALLVGRPEAEANAEDGFGRKYGLTVLLVAIRNAHNTNTFEMCTAQESYSVLPMFPRSHHGSHGDTRFPHAALVSGIFGLVIPQGTHVPPSLFWSPNTQAEHQWLLLIPESLLPPCSCVPQLLCDEVLKSNVTVAHWCGHGSAFASALQLEAISRTGDTRQGCLAGFHVTFLCVCAFPHCGQSQSVLQPSP